VGKFSGGYRYYTCWGAPEDGKTPRCRYHAVSAKALEEFVWQQVSLILRRPDLVLAEARRHRESRLGQRDEALMRLEYVRKALSDLPKERERVQILHREGYATLAEVKSHLSSIEDKRDRLEEERRTLETTLTEGTADEAQELRLEEVV